MTNNLVTVATFVSSVEATLVKQWLEAEGITAFLIDEATVNIAWHLTIAVGWIKLQVARPDIEQAMSILASTDLDDQSALETSADAISEEPLSFQGSEGDLDVERLSWADQTVERAFRGAVIGLIFLPLQLYSLWLLIRLLVSRRRISPNKRLKAAIAAVFNTPVLVGLWAIFL